MKVTLRRGPIRARPQTPEVSAALRAYKSLAVFFSVCVCFMCLENCLHVCMTKLESKQAVEHYYERISRRTLKQRKDREVIYYNFALKQLLK